MFAWCQRWRNRTKSLMKDVREIRNDVQKIVCLQGLDENKIFRFPMLGEEVQLYLPYAGFDLIQKNILTTADFSEGELLRYVRRMYFTGDRCKVLDIGGNLGNHAVFFAKFCNAAVTTFEPQSVIYKILRKNIELNAPDIVAYNMALGECEGVASIKEYDTSNTGGTRIEEASYGDIKMNSLDSFGYSGIDFIKIDVEGFESKVLKGGRETIINSKPVLWLEVFPENKKDVWAILTEFGYSFKEQLAEHDYIFLPNRSFC